MSRKLLYESEAYDMLKRTGVPVPENGMAKDALTAMNISDGIGYPVVMKVVSPNIVHKSDSGGVIIGIMNREDAEKAYLSIINNVSRAVPGADIEGVIVEKQMPPGLELIIGGKVDVSFGKVLTFGLGGTLVELMGDVALGILPLKGEDIRRMVHQIKGYHLISGYRNMHPRDEEALIDTIFKISGMFANNDDLVEFDINPLILYEKGACAVDARIYFDQGAYKKKEEKLTAVSQEIFYPRSIAVVGASANQQKVGYSILRNLLHFKGELYGVNPHEAEILGKRAYPSMDTIPGNVDMAILAVPGSAVPQVMEEAGKKGVKLAVVIAAGFREIGEEGEDLEKKMLDIAREHGIRS